MKKIILLALMSVHLFAWFGLEIPSEDVDLKGSSVKILDMKENKFVFNDSFKKNRWDDNYKSDVENRIKEIFVLINEYGQKKGYKSYILLNTGFNIGEIGLNNGDDIAKYCVLNTTNSGKLKYSAYDNYCISGKYPLLQGMGQVTSIYVKVVYFKDNTGNFSTNASY